MSKTLSLSPAMTQKSRGTYLTRKKRYTLNSKRRLTKTTRSSNQLQKKILAKLKASTQHHLQKQLLANIGAWADQAAHGQPAEYPGFDSCRLMKEPACSGCGSVVAIQEGIDALTPGMELEPLCRFLLERQDRPVQERLLSVAGEFTYESRTWS